MKIQKKNLGGGVRYGGIRVDRERRIEVFVKIQKNKGLGGWVVGGRGPGWGGQDECDRRIEVFRKIQKKNIFFWGGRVGGRGGGVGGRGWGVRVDVNEEYKFFMKNSKKNWGGCPGGEGRVEGGVRVDVNEELKFLGKFTQKKNWGGGGGLSGGGGSGWWGGQGGCERKIEVFVKIQKKIFFYFFFLGGGLGRGGGGWGSGLGVRLDVNEELKFL